MFSLREARDPLTLHITSQFRVMKNEELRKHSFRRDIAFSIERLPAGKRFMICDSKWIATACPQMYAFCWSSFQSKGTCSHSIALSA
jgi:hypothetical protein